MQPECGTRPSPQVAAVIVSLSGRRCYMTRNLVVWNDPIIILQTTKSLSPSSGDLEVINHCVDPIISKAARTRASLMLSQNFFIRLGPNQVNKTLSIIDSDVSTTKADLLKQRVNYCTIRKQKSSWKLQLMALM